MRPHPKRTRCSEAPPVRSPDLGDLFDSGVKVLDVVLGLRPHEDTAEDPGTVGVRGDLRAGTRGVPGFVKRIAVRRRPGSGRGPAPSPGRRGRSGRGRCVRPSDRRRWGYASGRTGRRPSKQGPAPTLRARNPRHSAQARAVKVVRSTVQRCRPSRVEAVFTPRLPNLHNPRRCWRTFASVGSGHACAILVCPPV